MYFCRATNELGEDMTEANLICRPLPHLQSVVIIKSSDFFIDFTLFISTDSSCQPLKTLMSQFRSLWSKRPPPVTGSGPSSEETRYTRRVSTSLQSFFSIWNTILR